MQTMTVTITALDGTQLYSQTVENLSVAEVIATVNKPQPEPPKKRKPRSDKGQPKPRKEAVQP
jgi:hypothetical protein